MLPCSVIDQNVINCIYYSIFCLGVHLFPFSRLHTDYFGPSVQFKHVCPGFKTALISSGHT